MFSYLAYGLNIQSELELPEFVSRSDDAAADISIRFGETFWTAPKGEDRYHQATDQEINFFFRVAGSFKVSGGCEIIVDPAPGAEERTLRLCVIGPVIAGLLHQRGFLVLHASAIVIDGVVVAFLGGKGWGKSTMAAYMQSRSHQLITDDVLALKVGIDGIVIAVPGFPQLKLWPNAAEFLGLNVDGMPRVQPDLDKVGHRLSCDFSELPLPLGHIYVLDMGDEVEILPLHLNDAFAEVVRHSYMVRYLQSSGTASAHFRQCTALVNSVPVSCLRRPALLNKIPEIAEILEGRIGQSLTM